MAVRQAGPKWGRIGAPKSSKRRQWMKKIAKMRNPKRRKARH